MSFLNKTYFIYFFFHSQNERLFISQIDSKTYQKLLEKPTHGQKSF